jgi:hypothetical protein
VACERRAVVSCLTALWLAAALGRLTAALGRFYAVELIDALFQLIKVIQTRIIGRAVCGFLGEVINDLCA